MTCARCGVSFSPEEVGVARIDLCYACDPDPDADAQDVELIRELRWRQATP